jgi:3-phenylpropionate/trans-cinnamate dioxygenase ferredoxin component
MSPLVDICPLEELPPGEKRLVEVEDLEIGVFNCNGTLFAIEDRCSHDDGPLCLGNWDAETCVAFCPRHGASFDIRSGRALSLPAYLPVRTFSVRVEDGAVKIEIP